MPAAAVPDLVDLCYRTVEEPQLWQTVTEALADTLGAEAGDLVIEDYAAGAARALGTLGFDPALRDSYDADFLGANLWVEGLKRFPAGRAVADHAEPPGFADSAFFNEWVRPQGYRRAVGALVERSDRHLVLMAYLRPARQGAFTEAESRRFDAVLPHVGRALRIARRLGAAEAAGARLAAMLDALPLAALVVDPRGRIVGGNAASEAAVAQGGLSTRGGRLRATAPAAAARLRAALGRCGSDPAAPAGIVPIDAEGPAPRFLEVVPFRLPDGGGPGGPACLVTVHEPLRPRDRLARPGLLADLYGLTATEEAVARAIGLGESPAAIAGATGSSVGTVRWHLKNVLSKLGVHSQAELASRVCRLLWSA